MGVNPFMAVAKAVEVAMQILILAIISGAMISIINKMLSACLWWAIMETIRSWVVLKKCKIIGVAEVVEVAVVVEGAEEAGAITKEIHIKGTLSIRKCLLPVIFLTRPVDVSQIRFKFLFCSIKK